MDDRRIVDEPFFHAGGATDFIVILDRRVQEHEEQLRIVKVRMDSLESLQAQNNHDTKEVLDIVSLGKGFFKVLGGLATGIKLILGVVTPIVALVYWLQHGGGKP